MLIQPNIRSVVSGFLFLLFAVAITPRIVLHDMAAKHRDSIVRVHQDGKPQLNKTVFQCNIDNLVAESPLDVQLFHFEAALFPAFPESEDHFLSVFLQSDHLLFGLRGPPAFA